MRKVSLTKLSTGWFHLCNIFEITKKWGTDSGFQEVKGGITERQGREVVVVLQEQHEGSLW